MYVILFITSMCLCMPGLNDAQVYKWCILQGSELTTTTDLIINVCLLVFCKECNYLPFESVHKHSTWQSERGKTVTLHSTRYKYGPYSTSGVYTTSSALMQCVLPVALQRQGYQSLPVALQTQGYKSQQGSQIIIAAFDE